MKPIQWIKGMGPLLLAAASILLFGSFTSEGNQVDVYENGKVTVQLETRYYSLDSVEEDVVEQLKLSPYDRYTVEREEYNHFHFKLERAYDVSVFVDGTTKTVKVLQETVETALSRCGVTLGEEDIVSLPLNYVLQPGESVTVNRITYRVTKTEKTLSYQNEYVYTPCLTHGVTQFLTAGENGIETTAVTEKLLDGVPVETVSTETTVTKQPKNAVYLVGDKNLSYKETNAPSFISLNANGDPESYEYLVTGKGTAYSAKKGAKTASGRYAIVGHVAVDPSVIPYGSLLYIKSADDSFIYGYAVAADTGIALMDGRVEVDLFFDTYEECCQFGAKRMEIYVIETP